MPNWNGLDVSVEAHRIATEVKAKTGYAVFPDDYTITAVKPLLRNFYVATGGNRSGTAIKAGRGYEPTTRELKRVYNGKISGAALLKAALKQSGAPEPKADEPEVVTEDKTDAQKLAELLAGAMGGQKVDPEAVKTIAKNAVDSRVGEVLSSMAALVADEVARQVKTVVIKVAELPEVKLDTHHKDFPRVLRFAANRVNVALVGPAGCGKTFMAEQIASTLGLEFYFIGKTVDEVKLLGYQDGAGTYHRTAFRNAYEYGGVFLADEMDGWSPEALIAVNAPLAGNWGDFPDGKVRKHPDFVCIAAMNTFGRGADRQYVGREQLDAASLDRFAVVPVDYDEDLELAIAGNRDWTLYVQKVRKAVEENKVRHVVSPRASIGGSIMLAAGDARADVEEAFIWKGLEENVRNRVKASLR